MINLQLHFAVENSSSSEKSGRWRFYECYAYEHIIVYFRSILKVLIYELVLKKHLYANDWVGKCCDNI